MAIGGALLGAGLTIGGYCPGTSVAGLFSERLDGLFFMFGLLLGVALFALSFPLIKPLFMAGKGPTGQTLAQLTGLPTWLLLLILIIVAVIGFRIGNQFEARGRGPLTATELTGKVGE